VPSSPTTIVVHHRHHPPLPLTSAAAVFCQRSHHCHSTILTAPLVTANIACLWQSLIAAIVTSQPPVPQLLSAALIIFFPNQPPLIAVELRSSSLLPQDVDCRIVNKSRVQTRPKQVICDGINLPYSGLLVMN
jgi:hypothetical protein